MRFSSLELSITGQVPSLREIGTIGRVMLCQRVKVILVACNEIKDRSCNYDVVA
jgi:hypothetical protein